MPLWDDFESEFGLRIQRKKQVRDVYQVVTTTKHTLCYKPYHFTEDEVAFIRGIFVHLDNKGYRYAPKPIDGPNNNLWTFHRGQYWLLTNWVKGRSPDFSRNSELNKALRTLASFHKHAEGLSAEKIPENRIRYEQPKRLPDEYRAEIRDYGGLERYIDLCNQAESYSVEPEITGAIEKERAAGAFCHGDYNYPNVVLDRSRHIHLIDLENASMNVRMTDLAHILYRNFPWDAKALLRAVEHYDSTRPLSAEDRHLLYMLLLLPYPLIRCLRRYGQKYHGHIELPSGKSLASYADHLRKLI
jgi:Ser/Thr protein kinase RdoA (MazF antagonist)